MHLECHQQRFFTLKMHQNRWRLGLRPRPHLGSLQRSPDPLAGLTGLPRREGENEEGEGKRIGGKERWREGKGRTSDPHNVETDWRHHCIIYVRNNYTSRTTRSREVFCTSWSRFGLADSDVSLTSLQYCKFLIVLPCPSLPGMSRASCIVKLRHTVLLMHVCCQYDEDVIHVIILVYYWV